MNKSSKFLAPTIILFIIFIIVLFKSAVIIGPGEAGY